MDSAEHLPRCPVEASISRADLFLGGWKSFGTFIPPLLGPSAWLSAPLLAFLLFLCLGQYFELTWRETSQPPWSALHGGGSVPAYTNQIISSPAEDTSEFGHIWMMQHPGGSVGLEEPSVIPCCALPPPNLEPPVGHGSPQAKAASLWFYSPAWSLRP